MKAALQCSYGLASRFLVRKIVSRAEMLDLRERYDGATDRPLTFSAVGGKLELAPAPDTSYTMEHLYFSRIPALHEGSPTNWMLDYHPDAYLYGALLHSAPYLVEDQRIAVWSTLYEAVICGRVWRLSAWLG